MQDPLTANERYVLDAFATAWNAFCRLPEEHPSDLDEAMAHVHAIQNLILARPALRYEKWLRLQDAPRDPDTSAAVTHTLADLDKPSPLRHA